MKFFREALKIAVFATFVIGCAQSPVAPPAKAPPGAPAVVEPAPTPTPAPTPPPASQDARQAVLQVVARHPGCTGYAWKERGRAPIGYFKGMSLAYHRAMCRGDKAPPLGGRFDALVTYRKPPTNLATYTLLIGLGLRESTGKYCTGRDTTNASSGTSETCEAGVFQMSYNIRFQPDGETPDPVRKAIYDEWKADQRDCNLEVWKEGLGNCDSKDLGTGAEGLRFQRFNKTCPGFAAAYAAAGVRTRMTHWGPLKTMATEYRQQCEAMLAAVEQVPCN